MRLKIGIVVFYTLFTFFIPALGVSTQYYFLFEYSNLFFFILFFFLFRKFLNLQRKKIIIKQIVLITILSLIFLIINDTLFSSMDQNSIPIEKVPLITLIESVTIVPFVEEIIFRYCFIPLHKNVWITGMLILSSSILFSLFHGVSLSIFIFGLLLSALYSWKKNLWYPLIVHYINNIIGIALYLISLR